MNYSRLLKYGFLIFCVASSKHIIIYNEEILVTLCSIGFAYFIYKCFADQIIFTMDEKSRMFHEEFEHKLKELKLEHTAQYHEAVLASRTHGGYVDLNTKIANELEYVALSKKLHVKILNTLQRERTDKFFKKLLARKYQNNAIIQEKMAHTFLPFAQANIEELSIESQKDKLIQYLKI